MHTILSCYVVKRRLKQSAFSFSIVNIATEVTPFMMIHLASVIHIRLKTDEVAYAGKSIERISKS